MKYLSLDVETTGLNPLTDQLLQVAMVVEDSDVDMPVEELPYLNVLVRNERVQGNAYALGMNGAILRKISGQDPTDLTIVDAVALPHYLEQWLAEQFPQGQRINVAGKNAAGFDIRFMPELVSRRFRHRVIDPGSVFVDWEKPMLPSLGDLLQDTVSHDALEDARDVIRVLRRSYPRNKE